MNILILFTDLKNGAEKFGLLPDIYDFNNNIE